MMKKRWSIMILISAVCLITALTAGCKNDKTATGNVDVEKYTMDLKLDTEKKTLSGEVVMALTNHAGETLDEICIRNYAASILADRGKGKSQFQSITTEDGQKLNFDTGRDPSVVYAKLDKSLSPGDSISLKVKFLTDIPKKNDRFGYRKDKAGQLFLLSFCFPQAAMYEDGKWNENPYIDGGESTFNKVTDYDIRLTAPEEYLIAASGEEMSKGSVTEIHAKDMRDMAIVACDYMEMETSTAAGVEINNYTLQYENSEKTNELTMAATKDSVELFTKCFGKYPYEELDVIQCFIQGGMEYPGLIMICLWDMAPENYYDAIDDYSNYTYLCELISHETGHEWFYAAVGNDQYEEPWLDEGFAEFCNILYDLERPDSAERAIAIEKQVNGDDGGGLLWWESEEKIEKWYLPVSTGEKKRVINKPYDWYDEGQKRGDYDSQVYDNGALFLYELKKNMGDEKFFEAMKEYYKTYCLKIATGEDFLNMIKKYDDSEKVEKVIEKYMEL